MAQRGRGRECSALHCERLIPRTRLMCGDHWFKIPVSLRNRITALWRDVEPFYQYVHGGPAHASGVPLEKRETLLVAYAVARLLATREVAVAEAWPIVELPECGLFEWRKSRQDLQGELGPAYAAEVAPYRARLGKLMADCGGGDPIEVTAIVIRLGEGECADPEKNKRRIAAALDLAEPRDCRG